MVLCLAASVVAAPATLAQPAAGAKLPELTALELTPASAPVPALKYQLLPDSAELKSGNAAVAYRRAAKLLKDLAIDEARSLKMLDWTEASVKDAADGKFLSREETRALAKSCQGVLDELAQASTYAHCEWELPRPKEGLTAAVDRFVKQGDFYEINHLASIADFCARVDILDGKYDRALRTLRSGLTLGRHIGHGPTLMHALIGVATAQRTADRLQEWVASPGAPNLYWALATLPRPFIDLRHALRGEQLLAANEYPEFHNLDAGPLSDKEIETRVRQARQRLDRSLDQMGKVVDSKRPPAQGLKRLPAVDVDNLYPAAKKSLLAQGVKREELDAMPRLQVVALAAARHCQRLQDDIYKWMYLPYSQGREGLRQTIKRAQAGQPAEADLLPCHLFLPQFESIYLAPGLAERRLAALCCLEAIRLSAAKQGGMLPTTLAEMDVPIPLNPFTGRAFEYRLSDGAAVLFAPPLTDAMPVTAFHLIHYRVTIKR
jgi:hypothetical protein